MQSPFDLRNAVVTQKSKRQVLIYDRIQEGIDNAINMLKEKQKNAIVRNIAYYIQGQLVVAQLFINRLNGFVPTEEARFGTTPTAYHIQLRFVHGFDTFLGNEQVFISNGNFVWGNLAPREIRGHVVDDIYHEMSLIHGPHVTVQDTRQELSITVPNSLPIQLTTSHEYGKGFEVFNFGCHNAKNLTKYYFNHSDYEQRHKLNAVYALAYLQPKDSPICRIHQEYMGYTQAQMGEFEPQDSHVQERRQAYQKWGQDISTILYQHPISSAWITNHQRSSEQNHPYLLDILSVNGMHLYTESGLMVDRLYDYQVELMQLFTQVYQRIRSVNLVNQLPNTVHASIVDMGVGAGKTYIINSVLKFLSRYYHDSNYAPTFCMTPDAALANVMVRVVNKQDGLAQIRSHAVTSAADIPDHAFLERYQNYAHQAVQENAAIRNYLQEGLQRSILEYCRTVCLHPFMIMNALYDSNVKNSLYQNSIDIKRLLLLVEGQKLIMEKTGLSPLVALRRLYDELEKIILAVDKERTESRSLFYNIHESIVDSSPSQSQQINYDQEVELPLSLRTPTLSKINLKNITADQLRCLLLQKFSYQHDVLQKSISIRNVLLRIACLSDVRAAILLANGGGLANTHTQVELTQQISDLLEPAARELRRGAESQRSMTFLQHRTYYLYLNEIFSTIPSAINSFTRYSTINASLQLLQSALRHNYQLLHVLRNQIGHRLAQLSQPQMQDRILGATLIEAVDHMAGQLGLLLSGRVEGDSAKLLSTHIPIFTPEGFVAYLEHLVATEGQAVVNIKYQQGVYLVRSGMGVINRVSIQQRLIQIFSTVMLADEVHKEAYQFLYDPDHPLYKRVNHITQMYLQNEFSSILPHRIGMSGTVNQIARTGFGQHTLYSLPLQDMIQRQLTKTIQITSLIFDETRALWTDYFQGNAWWTISKGIVFAKYAVSCPKLDIINVQHAHLNALRNQLFVHYLDFVLQKSGCPKELSEIVGLQNQLYAKGSSLIDAFLAPQDYDEDLQDSIRLLRNVSPDLISAIDVQHYVRRTLHDSALQALLIDYILQYRTNYTAIAQALSLIEVPISDFFTADVRAFEDGLAQVLMGTEAQQTGYSHEFVGAIVDASGMTIRQSFISFTSDPVLYYAYLQDLLQYSFSYDEKNQIGGRALRTVSGTASYLEYLSPNYSRESIFNIETSFSDIFIEDKNLAKHYRSMVMFNRMILATLNEFDGSFDAFVDHIVAHCHKDGLLEEYHSLMEEHLPAWWALKYQPELVNSESYSHLQSQVRAKIHQDERAQVHDMPDSQHHAGWVTRHISPGFTPVFRVNFSIWLTWMTLRSSLMIGGILIIAGLGVLAATSMGFVATALVINGSKGLVITGSLLVSAVLSRNCYTFFSRTNEVNNVRETDHQMDNSAEYGRG